MLLNQGRYIGFIIGHYYLCFPCLDELFFLVMINGKIEQLIKERFGNG